MQSSLGTDVIDQEVQLNYHRVAVILTNALAERYFRCVDRETPLAAWCGFSASADYMDGLDANQSRHKAIITMITNLFLSRFRTLTEFFAEWKAMGNFGDIRSA